MNLHLIFLRSSLLLTCLLVPLTGCAGNDSSGEEETSSGGTGSTDSELQDRLSACPELDTSSDPSASACLIGSYEGETVSGDPCTLEILAGGAFSFTSPALSASFTAPPDSIFVYGYNVIEDYHQLIWKASDPISTEAWYELDFQARFGTGVPDSDRKIEIEVTERSADATTSVACVVPL